MLYLLIGQQCRCLFIPFDRQPVSQNKTCNEFLTWNAERVADYFARNGLEDYHETIIHHRITGKVACRLNDVDLTDMGIILVGDRCRFRYHIQNMTLHPIPLPCDKVLWQGEEKLFFGCVDEAFGKLFSCSK